MTVITPVSDGSCATILPGSPSSAASSVTTVWRLTVTTPLPVSMPWPVLFSRTFTSFSCARVVALIHSAWTRGRARMAAAVAVAGCRRALAIGSASCLRFSGSCCSSEPATSTLPYSWFTRYVESAVRTSLLWITCVLAFSQAWLSSICRSTQVVRMLTKPMMLAQTISAQIAILRRRPITNADDAAAGGAGLAIAEVIVSRAIVALGFRRRIIPTGGWGSGAGCGGDDRGDARAAAWAARHRESAADGLDAVAKPLQTEAVLLAGAAFAVVCDLDRQESL